MALPGIEFRNLPPDVILEIARALKDAVESILLTIPLYAICMIVSRMYNSEILKDLAKDFGVFLLDTFLRQPPVRLFRLFLRNMNNRTVIEANRPSLLQLPSELILHIAHLAATTPCQTHGYKGSCLGQRTSHKELANLSMTGKRVRALLSPILFKSVSVKHSWRTAARALKAMERSSDAYLYAKAFNIDLYIGRRKGPRPPQHLPTRLATILPAFQQLSIVTLVIPEHHTEQFRKAFKDKGVSLVSVRSLVLGPHIDWVISMCPNVESVCTNAMRWMHSNVDGDSKSRHSFDLISAAGLARKLRHFEMDDWWQRRQVWAIGRAMPNIESLAMPGGRYMDSIAEFMPILSHFKTLRTLVLADASNLGVGFDPPGCGNVYFGPEGAEHRKQVFKEQRDAENTVAKMAFAEILGLKELWVGDYAKGIVKRSSHTRNDGEIEWTYGKRPRPGESLLFRRL